MKQNFIYTCLPHYRDSDNLYISVAISMQLEPGNPTTLATFPDLDNWPQRLLNGKYRFRFGNTEVDATLNSEKLDNELWQELMHNDIRVLDFNNPPYENYRVHSYPTKHVQQFVLKSYAKYAVSHPDKLLGVEEFLDKSGLGEISRYQPMSQAEYDQLKDQPRREEVNDNQMTKRDERTASLEKQMQIELEKNKFIAFREQADARRDFIQIRDFHKVDKRGVEGPLPELKKPEFEFHDILSIVSSYPQIQRKLGLVLDFVIPVSNAIPNSGSVRFLPSLGEFSDPASNSCPLTAFEITSNGFFVRSVANSNLNQGFVSINTPQFTTTQIDVDGTALKLNNLADNKIIQDVKLKVVNINLAASKKIQSRDFEDEKPEDVGLPVIRSAGIGVARNGISEVLHQKFAKSETVRAAFFDQNNLDANLQLTLPPDPLYADDLVQGYRMDIAYESKPDKWFSLHWKKDEVSYITSNKTTKPIEAIEADEGFIQIAAAEDTESQGDIFTGEVMFRWEGWSLATTKPGFAINEDDADHDTDYVNTDKQLESKKYALDEDMEFRMNAIPQVVKGTLPRLRFGQQYRLRVRTVDLAGNSIPLEFKTANPGKNEIREFRYLRYEPVASPILHLGTPLCDGEALEHAVIRSNFDQSTGEFESSSEEAHPAEVIRHVLPPKNSQLMAENHGKFDEAMGANPQKAKEFYQLIISREEQYEAGENNSDKVYETNKIDVLYLPDPMGQGVSFFLAKGYENSHSQEFRPKMFSFFENKELWTTSYNRNRAKMEWINAEPMRIRLAEGNIGTDWDASERLLTIYLPKGERTRLKYSSWWYPDDIEDCSAIWRDMGLENPSKLDDLKKLVRTGQHWMISPSREIEIVHAVLQPVDAPTIEDVRPDRNYDETEAWLNMKFTAHGHSTLKLDVAARWEEPFDEVHKLEPEIRPFTGEINNITVAYHESAFQRGSFPQKGQLVQAVVLGKGALKQEFPDTRHRKVNYQVYGTSRYQEYFDKLIKAKGLSSERDGGLFEQVIIPSTRRPAPPDVDYIIPTFEWVEDDGDTKMVHTRKGGGLRVYLKRPWYSSGEGEKLAILIQNSASDPSKTLKVNVSGGYSDLLTQWAVDPIKLSQPPGKTGPEIEDFRYNPKHDRGLSYPGREPGKVDAVAYPVTFDKERKLWFADIRLEPGQMYFPFIKLVLARYQEHSVRKDNTDVCLSKPVFPEFIQLPPTRKCTVDFKKDDVNSKFTITIEGFISFISGQYAGPSNYFNISFHSHELPQPVDMIVDDYTNDNRLEKESTRIYITNKDIQNNYFRISKEFKLPGHYKHEPFIILIKEFELANTSGDKTSYQIKSLENQDRLVFADRFNVNETK